MKFPRFRRQGVFRQRSKKRTGPTAGSRCYRIEQLEPRYLLNGGPPLGAVAPDFSLLDANSTSATYNQPVSPRDFLGQTSGWYFGHAT